MGVGSVAVGALRETQATRRPVWKRMLPGLRELTTSMPRGEPNRHSLLLRILNQRKVQQGARSSKLNLVVLIVEERYKIVAQFHSRAASDHLYSRGAYRLVFIVKGVAQQLRRLGIFRLAKNQDHAGTIRQSFIANQRHKR